MATAGFLPEWKPVTANFSDANALFSTAAKQMDIVPTFKDLTQQWIDQDKEEQRAKEAEREYLLNKFYKENDIKIRQEKQALETRQQDFKENVEWPNTQENDRADRAAKYAQAGYYKIHGQVLSAKDKREQIVFNNEQEFFKQHPEEYYNHLTSVDRERLAHGKYWETKISEEGKESSQRMLVLKKADNPELAGATKEQVENWTPEQSAQFNEDMKDLATLVSRNDLKDPEVRKQFMERAVPYVNKILSKYEGNKRTPPQVLLNLRKVVDDNIRPVLNFSIKKTPRQNTTANNDDVEAVLKITGAKNKQAPVVKDMATTTAIVSKMLEEKGLTNLSSIDIVREVVDPWVRMQTGLGPNVPLAYLPNANGVDASSTKSWWDNFWINAKAYGAGQNAGGWTSPQTLKTADASSFDNPARIVNPELLEAFIFGNSPQSQALRQKLADLNNKSSSRAIWDGKRLQLTKSKPIKK